MSYQQQQHRMLNIQSTFATATDSQLYHDHRHADLYADTAVYPITAMVIFLFFSIIIMMIFYAMSSIQISFLQLDIRRYFMQR